LIRFIAAVSAVVLLLINLSTVRIL
jgi:hypothetical protein